MKHLSIKIEGPPEHDENRSFCRIFNDRSGNAQILSDFDTSYWMARMPELGFEPSDWAVTSPQPGHVINSNNHKGVDVLHRVGDTLILTVGDHKELMRIADIRTETAGVEPSEVYKDGRLVPTWNLGEFDLVRCRCRALVPLLPNAQRGTWSICSTCSDDEQSQEN